MKLDSEDEDRKSRDFITEKFEFPVVKFHFLPFYPFVYGFHVKPRWAINI